MKSSFKSTRVSCRAETMISQTESGQFFGKSSISTARNCALLQTFMFTKEFIYYTVFYSSCFIRHTTGSVWIKSARNKKNFPETQLYCLPHKIVHNIKPVLANCFLAKKRLTCNTIKSVLAKRRPFPFILNTWQEWNDCAVFHWDLEPRHIKSKNVLCSWAKYFLEQLDIIWCWK